MTEDEKNIRLEKYGKSPVKELAETLSKVTDSVYQNPFPSEENWQEYLELVAADFLETSLNEPVEIPSYESSEFADLVSTLEIDWNILMAGGLGSNGHVYPETIIGLPPENPEAAHYDFDDLTGVLIHQTMQHRLLEGEEVIRLVGIVKRGLVAENLIKMTGIRTPLLDKAVAYGRAAERDMYIYNQRLVLKWAKHFHSKHLKLPDLIQSGNIGLRKGIRKFDPGLGYAFSTYASWHIRRTIIRYIRHQDNLIKLPIALGDKLYVLGKSESELMVVGEEVTPESLAEKMGEKVGLVKQLLEYREKRQSCLRFDYVTDEEDDDDFLNHFRPPGEELRAHANQSDNRVFVEEMLSKLDDREAMIIRLHFGLGDEPPWSLEDIGQKLGLTRERIRQIEAAALKHLREKYRVILGNSIEF